MVSITRVDTTSDLRYARVYISVLDKDQEKDVPKGSKSAGGFLRRELGRAPAAAIHAGTAVHRRRLHPARRPHPGDPASGGAAG
ncbi:MAG: ribosome-binding factor A [Oscillibacter sp.]